MNNYLKTFFILLFTAGFLSPLMAQKKLALANECFNAKAYYLASRYYQDYFDKSPDDCHPDQIKRAQSLAAIQQLPSAEATFNTYMSCQQPSPADNIAYGKFLIDIKAYEKAIPYFERAVKAEPQLARHYLLVCQTALPKQKESSNTVLIKQDINPSEALAADEISPKGNLVETRSSSKAINPPTLTASTEMHQTPIAATVGITSYESTETRIETDLGTLDQQVKTNLSPEPSKSTNKATVHLVAEKKFSPYGVRLGTYHPSRIPDLSPVEGYGRIEQRKWKGKIIFFLVDFPDRGAAEATVKLATQKNFRSATLVEKLSSGRMKSVR